MKDKPRFSLAIATALFAVTVTPTQAQTWEQLLPSSSIAPVTAGYPNVLLDPFSSNAAKPGLFVGHSRGSGAVSLYRLTPDDPEALSYFVEPVDNGLETVRRLAYSDTDGTPNGTLYAVGSGIENRASVWKVRKSETGGDANTWVDDGASFSLKKGASSIATGVTGDASGSVYACGRAFDGPAPHWIVRRKISGGTWTTVHDLKGTGDTTAYGISFCAQGGNNPADAILAVGNLNNKWAVVRSQNQGASGTWQVVDSWSPDSKPSATAIGVACDSSGNIYVAGARGTWDAPNSWTTVLDAAEGNASWGFAVAVDGADNLWISGMTQNASGTPRWTVLKNNVSQTWSDSWASRQCPG